MFFLQKPEQQGAPLYNVRSFIP